MNRTQSDELYARAVQRIPGGVNSPVRAFRSVGMDPLFIASASGSRLRDVDGNEYIDYIGSWGPMILGHAHPAVIGAIQKASRDGTSFGAATALEVRMAELICSLIPSVEMVRMVNSGTEATMSAIRLARAFTGRDKIVKFEGCYHGHADSFLVRAGSGALTFGTPDSPGVPSAVAADTLVATFNDAASVRLLFGKYPKEIAALIVEPVVGNMGCIPPINGFLEALRDLCTDHGTVLIFDEVMTGFRVAPGGAQELYGITPDLTTLGKIIGGGLPVGAYGGRREIMQNVSPAGPVYQAGTLSGNPLAMAAGYETLRLIREDESFYQRMDEKGRMLEDGIRNIARSVGEPVTINRLGSMFTLFFVRDEVVDFGTAVRADRERFGMFFREMVKEGVCLPPSQFEAAFLSAAHSEGDIDRTLKAVKSSLERMRGGR
jgi:glutamate-1-semialdehyde 2,1-aminomutase